MLNAIFVTLTYPRDESVSSCWLRATSDWNRFVQRTTRAFGNVSYLRVFEAHDDGYPHVHALLLIEHIRNFQERSQFLYDDIFFKFKSLWIIGNSDFQSPKIQSKNTIRYIVKYVGKSTSAARLWSNILTPTITQSPTLDADGYPIRHIRGTNIWKSILVLDQRYLLYSTLKIKKIKLMSWSRNFIERFKEFDV